LSPMAIKGMIGLAGPYDFLPLKSNRLKTIFGPENERWKSQPINFVAGENPPMLLLVGEKDRTVLPRNTYHLADKVKQKGGKVELISFQDYNHVQMISHLAKPLRKDGKLRASIIEFLERN
ncbi:MAG TPA: alpha/beta hydrolase, partial [Methylophaga aminisulfidivorans]|nr:alpha/beta hydrolase [Methylophaga aminisulfidivorans]